MFWESGGEVGSMTLFSRALLGVAAVACLGIAALGATSRIVGVWSMTVHDRYGEAFAVVWDEFTPDGRLHVKLVTRAGTEDYFGVYRLIRGGTVVQSRFTDYEPKQLCTLVCSPITPVFPMNKTGVSPVRFVGTSTMYLGTDPYNRQR
jgi:hypothetical protein